MRDQSTPFVGEPATDPALLRILAAADLPATERFLSKAGWVSRAWVGDDYVVRLNNGQFRDAFQHEARVVSLLADSEVPHARHLAHGDGPDGPWYISERLPGQTLHEVWPTADSHTRQTIIESIGTALRASSRFCSRGSYATLADRRIGRWATICIPPTRRGCGSPAGRGCPASAWL